MQSEGWPQLFADWSWVRGEGRFPIAAYSEYMPPPRVGQKPYGPWEIESPFARDDLWGWHISACEQEQELTPGLADIARQLIDSMVALASGQGAHRIGAAGDDFDPERHEAIAVQPSADVPDRTILAVERSGFALGDRVIRPAQVVVARTPEHAR